MYQDSGVFLREGPPSAFAERRAARRIEQGLAPPQAWRSAAGAVLRLAPHRLAELAALARAAAPPEHPAAADPHAAVLHRVALLAREAYPAGTFHDPETGQRRHVFRARGGLGGVGGWELVTAPPRGALYDIVDVRPAVDGEGRVPVGEEPVHRDAGPPPAPDAEALVSWRAVPLREALAERMPPGELYLLVKERAGHPFGLEPLFVSRAETLAARWRTWVQALHLFAVDPAPYTLWVGAIDPPAEAAVHPGVPGATRAAWLRRDVERALAHTLGPRAILFHEQHSSGRVHDASAGEVRVHNRPAVAAPLPLFLPPQLRWRRR